MLEVVLAAAQLRRRLGQDRVPAGARQRRRRRGQRRRPWCARRGSRRGGTRVSSSREGGHRSRGRPPRRASATSVSGRSPRPSRAMRLVAVTAPSSGSGASGSVSGTFRCTGPGGRPRACGHGPHGGRAVVEQARVVGGRDAQLAEPAHRVAVQLELVDRLPGAAAAQLGRAVGGQHDQRHARLVRLGDGGVEVGPRRAGGGHDHGRLARSACAMPSAKNPAQRSSTWLHTRIAGLVPQRQRERRRARPGRHAGVPHARARQLLRERGGEGGVAVGRVHGPGR